MSNVTWKELGFMEELRFEVRQINLTCRTLQKGVNKDMNNVLNIYPYNMHRGHFHRAGFFKMDFNIITMCTQTTKNREKTPN